MDRHIDTYDRHHAGPDADSPTLTDFERHAFAGLLDRLLNLVDIEGGPAAFQHMRTMADELRSDSEGDTIELALAVVAEAREHAESDVDDEADARDYLGFKASLIAARANAPAKAVEIAYAPGSDDDPEPWQVSIRIVLPGRGRRRAQLSKATGWGPTMEAAARVAIGDLNLRRAEGWSVDA